LSNFREIIFIIKIIITNLKLILIILEDPTVNRDDIEKICCGMYADDEYHIFDNLKIFNDRNGAQ